MLPASSLRKPPPERGTGGSFRASHREDRDLESGPREVRRGLHGAEVLGGVGDEHHLSSAQARLGEQLPGPAQAEIGTAAPNRHQLRRQGRKQGVQGLGVVGQRGDQEGVARIHHQSGLAFPGPGEDVGGLETRPGQP